MMIEGRNELAEAKWAPGGLPWWLRQWSICLQCGRAVFNPWVRKIPWRRKWQPTPVPLPGKSHGRMSVVDYSPCGRRVGHNWVTFTSLHFTCLGNNVLIADFSLQQADPFKTRIVRQERRRYTKQKVLDVLILYLPKNRANYNPEVLYC